MKKILIILGTSRKNGNMMAGVKYFMKKKEAELIDLSDKRISYYDYNHANREDDFVSIATKMTQVDAIVFATPVYWYAMSAPLKTFFDRLSDLLTIHKPLGRALKGKKAYLMACGSSAALPEGFEVPFKLTANYFDMTYTGSVYWQTPGGNLKQEAMEEKVGDFVNLLF